MPPQTPPDRELRAQINKRLTLNLLIQGFAMWAGHTAHRLIRDPLETFDPNLTKRYDKLAAYYGASHYRGLTMALLGGNARFWKRTHRPDHPFHDHPLLARHGRTLYTHARRHYCRLLWRYKVPPVSPFIDIGGNYHTVRCMWTERLELFRLSLALEIAAERVWGVPLDRVDGQLAYDCTVEGIRPPTGRRGRWMRRMAVGWSHVVRDDEGRLCVEARALNGPLLLHELVKGVAELICLHGLNRLDDETYAAVIDATDLLEYEVPMLQAGPELARRLLKLLEPDPPPAIYLMELARLDPEPLEALMLNVIENPDDARIALADLVAHHTAPLDDTVGLG